ncbi:hypothetical protein JCM10213_008281 [Rhodosporidiobolus nylandii]
MGRRRRGVRESSFPPFTRLPSAVAPPFEPTVAVLPLELFAHVLSYVDEVDWRPWQADMARCCLVSRAFLSLARPRLYRVLKFRLGEASNISLQRHDTATLLMYETVCQNPDLALHVRRLQLGFDGYRTYELASTYLDMNEVLEGIFTSCTNLKELVVREGYTYPLAAALASRNLRPRVRALELGEVTDLAWLVLDLLRGSVQHLALQARDWASVQTMPRVVPPLPLTSLHITCFRGTPVLSLTTLFNSIASTLTHLQISSPLTALPAFSTVPNLRHLHLEFPSGNKERYFADLSSLLDECSNLHTLAISAPSIFTLSNIRTLSSSAPDAFPAHLPPSLERLHLRAPYFFPVDLIAILRAAPQAKKLGEIGREPYQLHLGKRDRKKRPELPTHEEEEELERECRKRGVRLVAL